MQDGFIKTAAGIPDVVVADVEYNKKSIKKVIDSADAEKINLLCLTELCITGYTCGDLFFSDTLIYSAKDALKEITEYTIGKYPVVIVGVPILFNSKLYNCAAVICDGKILGIVPKSYLPNYSEFYEKRQFFSGIDLTSDNTIQLFGERIPFSPKIIFTHSIIPEFCFGIEICEDVWSIKQPSEDLALSGAIIINNLSASDEVIGKEDYRKMLIKSTSGRLLSGYVYSSASFGESTQDLVYSGHCMICENGTLLSENKPFEQRNLVISEIDVKKLSCERRKNTSFIPQNNNIRNISFDQEVINTQLTRSFAMTPFVPSSDNDVNERAESILRIQSYGLRKRLMHTKAKAVVIGISGGLDSTLALLACIRAIKLLNRPATDIVAITMPCFGTTKRTRSNSEKLCNLLGVTFKEINITDSVKQHFSDINQDINDYSVTFENSQARERTQVLMDYANKIGGIVLGTGDLSELALGWATYNGDHMSMYAINCSVPKTLVRYIVRHEADASSNDLKEVLYDILNTPVSPELLPFDENGDISQKTEDLVGPYELHDFFLYHLLRNGESASKIYRLANISFCGKYDNKVILSWLKVFIKRFFAQQFKRSCIPDGPKVGSVTLSPRGDWRMPSDASPEIWIKELDDLEAL